MTLAAAAVANAVEYRFLRDGVEVRGWGTSPTHFDGLVPADGMHSYTYEARNPGSVSSRSAAAQAERTPQAPGKHPFNAHPFGVSRFGKTRYTSRW